MEIQARPYHQPMSTLEHATAWLESPEQGLLPITWTRMLHIANPEYPRQNQHWCMYSHVFHRKKHINPRFTQASLIKSLRMTWVSMSDLVDLVYGHFNHFNHFNHLFHLVPIQFPIEKPIWRDFLVALQRFPRPRLSAPTFHKSVLSPRSPVRRPFRDHNLHQSASIPTNLGNSLYPLVN